jgi:dsRNA-specific ribonuclease
VKNELNLSDLCSKEFKNTNLLVDALIGAIFVDMGYNNVLNFYKNVLIPIINEKYIQLEKKNFVQEIKEFLNKYKAYPEYKFLSEKVPKVKDGLYVGKFLLKIRIIYKRQS